MVPEKIEDGPLIECSRGDEHSDDRGRAGFGAPRTHSRGVFGQLGGGGLALLALSRSARSLAGIGKLLGAPEAASALLIAAGAIFLVVLFRLSLRISGLKDSNIALTQRIAILEYRLENIDEKVKTPAG